MCKYPTHNLISTYEKNKYPRDAEHENKFIFLTLNNFFNTWQKRPINTQGTTSLFLSTKYPEKYFK